MKWALCNEEEQRGLCKLTCLWICFCDSEIDEVKDFALMSERRCWEFNVSIMSGFLKHDF
jgi:hypothetical protein